MKPIFFLGCLLATLVTISCSSIKKLKSDGDIRPIKTGDIMEMNSKEFLVQNNTWNLQTTEHFKFYFDKNIDVDLRAAVIKAQEINYSEIVKLMNLEDLQMEKINFWVFKNKEQKFQLTKVNSDAHAISTFPSVYYLPKNALGAQEVGHVITQSQWGFIPKTSNYALIIDEGFNYYIDNERFYKNDLYSSVKRLSATDPVNVMELITRNSGNIIKGVETGSHELNESLISGAFVQYLIENFGIDKFADLWKKAVKSEYADPNIFPEIYDRSLQSLSDDFLN